MKRILLFVAGISSMTVATNSYACQCIRDELGEWQQVGSCTPEQLAEGCEVAGGGSSGSGGGDRFDWPEVPIVDGDGFSFFMNIMIPKKFQSQPRSFVTPSRNPTTLSD